MTKTIVISGHPSYEGSFANKIIAEELSKVEGVTVRLLSEHASAAGFDAEAERQALLDSDIIIFQFPIQWLNLPFIFRQWLSQVFSPDFAADSLSGKYLIVSITTGSKYVDGSLKGLLDNMEEFARYAGMTYAGHVVSDGFLFIPFLAGDKTELRAKALKHAEILTERIGKCR